MTNVQAVECDVFMAFIAKQLAGHYDKCILAYQKPFHSIKMIGYRETTDTKYCFEYDIAHLMSLPNDEARKAYIKEVIRQLSLLETVNWKYNLPYNRRLT